MYLGDNGPQVKKHNTATSMVAPAAPDPITQAALAKFVPCAFSCKNDFFVVILELATWGSIKSYL